MATQEKIVELFWFLRDNIYVFEFSVFLHVKFTLASEAGESNLSGSQLLGPPSASEQGLSPRRFTDSTLLR